jgi:hypothetical protein
MEPGRILLGRTFGIVVTEAIVGVGGDSYWGLAHFGGLDPPFVAQRNTAMLGVFVFLAGLCDLVANGVIFAGAVILVQRLGGVPSED